VDGMWKTVISDIYNDGSNEAILIKWSDKDQKAKIYCFIGRTVIRHKCSRNKRYQVKIHYLVSLIH
jgi:hypothetical protein